MNNDKPMIKVTSLKHDTFEAYYAARAADDAWQEALDSQGVERYSKQAKGVQGSEFTQNSTRLR